MNIMTELLGGGKADATFYMVFKNHCQKLVWGLSLSTLDICMRIEFKFAKHLCED